MASHRLCFNTKAIKQEETQRQLTRLHDGRGSLKHDDRVDVLSAAVSYWEDNLGVNIDNVIAKNKEKEQMDVIKDWMDDKRRARSILQGRSSGALRITNRLNRRFGREG
jgi:hypothetical protein